MTKKEIVESIENELRDLEQQTRACAKANVLAADRKRSFAIKLNDLFKTANTLSELGIISEKEANRLMDLEITIEGKLVREELIDSMYDVYKESIKDYEERYGE